MFKTCFKYLIFLENVNIDWSLENLTGIFLAPKIFRKEMDYILYFCVHFRKCSNLLRLSYFELKFSIKKTLISVVTDKCWRLQRAVLAPPSTPRNDANLSCSFI